MYFFNLYVIFSQFQSLTLDLLLVNYLKMDLSSLEPKQNSNRPVNQSQLFNNGVNKAQKKEKSTSHVYTNGSTSSSPSHSNHSSKKRSQLHSNHHNSPPSFTRATSCSSNSHSRSPTSPPFRTLLPAGSRPHSSCAGGPIAIANQCASRDSRLQSPSASKLAIQRLLSHQTAPAVAILKRLNSHPISSSASDASLNAGTIMGSTSVSSKLQSVTPHSAGGGIANFNAGTNSYSITFSNQRMLYYIILLIFIIYTVFYKFFKSLIDILNYKYEV